MSPGEDNCTRLTITSQRGSAWQCYIGRWLCRGKHAFFHLSPWKNHQKFSNQFWQTWLRLGDLQAHLIWLRSVHGWRRYTVVKYYGFVTFVLPFFLFPHLAYRSQLWTDSHVLWLKRRVLFRTRAFSGFEAFEVNFKGPSAPKTPNMTPVFGWT